MKKLLTLLGSGATLALMLAAGAHAQQNQPQPTPVIEIYPCTYREGNDIDNLRTVSARFNTWADRNNLTTYTAFTATPYAYSEDLEVDVLWLGGYPNGTAMGVGETRVGAGDQHIASQRDLEPAGYGNPVDCADHRLAADLDRLDRVFVGTLGIGGPQCALLRA